MRTTKADRLLGHSAGAPLRAIAILTAIWVVARIISWNGPANETPNPVNSIIGVAARDDVNEKVKKLPTRLSPASEKQRRQASAKVSYQSMPVAGRRLRISGTEQSPTFATSEQPGFRWQSNKDGRGFSLQSDGVKSGLAAQQRIRTIMSLPNSGNPQRSNRLGAYLWIYARANSMDGQPRAVVGGRSILNGQYGGSQAGAILSYRLLDRPAPDLSVYTRLSAALAPWSQQEIAVGARIRPMPEIPLAMHAEQRFDVGSGSDAGTAFYLTGGSGPDQIIERFALETYAQAGYVLGQNETYFFDGSAVLQRPIASLGKTKLSLGSGVWAGGQRDLSRIDIGPRAAVTVSLGNVSARIAVDWRLRIAGNARPASGPAITVSTGF